MTSARAMRLWTKPLYAVMRRTESESFDWRERESRIRPCYYIRPCWSCSANSKSLRFGFSARSTHEISANTSSDCQRDIDQLLVASLAEPRLGPVRYALGYKRGWVYRW